MGSRKAFRTLCPHAQRHTACNAAHAGRETAVRRIARDAGGTDDTVVCMPLMRNYLWHPQDVIGRGSKLHPLYARVVEARAPRAIVVPVHEQRGLQVIFCNPRFGLLCQFHAFAS